MSDDLKAQRTPGTSISVVIPVYLNENTLEELVERLLQTLRPLEDNFELIFVNDASPDGSSKTLSQLKDRFVQIKQIELSSNSGQQNAIRVGLREARNDVIAVMDADLQDPPEAIADLYRALQAGNSEAVFAQRTERYQGSRRMMSSRLFKWLVRKMVGLPKGTGCFLIIRRKMASEVLSFETKRFYLPGLVAKTNLPIHTIPLQRATRASGKSAYDSSMRLNVAISNIRCLLERK